MSSLIKNIFPCFSTRKSQPPADPAKYQLLSEKSIPHPFSPGTKEPTLSTDEAASSITSAILTADKPGADLTSAIQSLVHQAGGWDEYLGRAILAALEIALKAGAVMGAAMHEAYDKAVEAVKEIPAFAKENPVVTGVFATVIALGVLVILAPYVLEWLGFAELGPIEGSWAAVWQATYRGLVPKGSLFSYFQRLGMTWKRVVVSEL